MKVNELEKLIEYYHRHELAHAYLISTNNIQKCYQVLLKVIKNIFCVQEYQENCKKCSLCHLIDINNLPSLITIEPDGNFIKKEQVLNLRSSFSRKSQYTKESIYIIKNAEKMNKEAANTMLKFLEEPEGMVIGFFITNHKDNVMPTISSRCQNIEVNFNNSQNENFNIDISKYNYYIEIVKEYLYKIEVEKKELILYNRKYLSDLERDDIVKILQIILSIYEQLLNKNMVTIEFSNINFLNNLSFKNRQKKVNLLIEMLKEINYNVNIDLFLDRFVLEMDGINNECL